MNAYTKSGEIICEGPCVVCGMIDYRLSMGGPNICPACDCGISVDDKNHPKNLFAEQLALAVKRSSDKLYWNHDTCPPNQLFIPRKRKE